MKRLSSTFHVLLLTLAVLVGGATHAFAGALDDAKDAGQIGERLDGFVAAVTPNPAPAIVKLVDQINRKRQAAYEEIASQEGVPVEQVAALAAEKIKAQAPAGHYFMNSDGQWEQK